MDALTITGLVVPVVIVIGWAAGMIWAFVPIIRGQ
jgi:ABC-type uncharacterized transport system permease subunit